MSFNNLWKKHYGRKNGANREREQRWERREETSGGLPVCGPSHCQSQLVSVSLMFDYMMQ